MSLFRVGGYLKLEGENITKAKGIEKTATVLTKMGVLFIGFLSAFSLVFLVILWDITKAYLLAGTLGCLLVLLLPALLPKRYDVFQPLSFAILSVAIGVTGRTIYILFNKDGAERLLLGEDPQFLLPAILATLVGLLFFVVGYMQNLPKLSVRRLKIARSDEWDVRRLWIVVLLFTGVSLIATVLFLQKTGFEFQDLTSISRKRFLMLEESEVGYTALGYLRWAASLSQIAFMLVMAWFVSSGKRWLSALGFAIIVMFGIAVTFPFLTSSRGSLLWLVFSSMIMWHYLRRPISTRTVAGITIIAVVVLSVMINLRRGDVNLTTAVSLESISERLFGSRDFLDITTTAHIIAAIQEGRLGHSYGWTYLTWLYAPIPRTMWPEKPVVSVGWEIKRRVFGFESAGGIPPGAIGEAFWAFGFLGVIIIMWLLGGIVGSIYRSLKVYVANNKNMALVYTFLFLPWLLAVLGSDWSNALVCTLQKGLPLILALYFITQRKKLGGGEVR